MTTPTVTSQSAALTSLLAAVTIMAAVATNRVLLMFFSLLPVGFLLACDLHPGFLQMAPDDATWRRCFRGQHCGRPALRGPPITILSLHISKQDGIGALPERFDAR